MITVKYTYAVPTVDGEPMIRIKIRKKEKVYDYQIYPDKHVFKSNYYHVELKDFIASKEED